MIKITLQLGDFQVGKIIIIQPEHIMAGELAQDTDPWGEAPRNEFVDDFSSKP